MRPKPTLEIIRNHIFNWSIWPDFTQIPTPSKPFMRYEPMQLGETVELKGRKITSLPANHVVPAVGFQVDSGQASLVFTGDTTTHDPLWKVVNKITNLRYLIIETAFCNRERELAVAAKHFCPSLLAEELPKLERSAEIFITHLKPGRDRADHAGDRGLRRTVQAAHAAEQPGIRVLTATGTSAFTDTRMAVTKVSVEALRILEPLSSLSDARLKELAQLCCIESVRRTVDPFHLRPTAGQSVYVVRGELALAYGQGSSEVIVGGSAEAR